VRSSASRGVRVVVSVACCVIAMTVAPSANALVAGKGEEILRVVPGGTDVSCATGCASISYAVGRASFDLGRDAASSVRILVAAGSYDDHVTIPSGDTITITGAGADATVVRGGLSGTVFTVASGATATITDLTVTGGSAENGGGVSNSGTLTLQRDTVAFNAATGAQPSGGFGGGIFNQGTLELDDSTIEANQAQYRGAGVDSSSSIPADIMLERDAIIGNSVTGTSDDDRGAGLSFEGGIHFRTVSDSTIVDNTVLNNGAGGGIAVGFGAILRGDTIADNSAPAAGGVWTLAGSPVAEDTIIADNRGGDNCSFHGGTVSGHDLSNDSSCFDSTDGDLIDVDPRLGPLADNGGPTKTLAIGADSPAHNAATAEPSTPLVCSGTDQRGISRLQRGATRCDIGAYQVAIPTLYVANPGANSVTGYPPGLSGNLPPALALSGPDTGVNNPNGIAVDVTGEVFVANANANSITEYPAGASGDAAPSTTIAGPHTQLNDPQGLARDDAGHLFVANFGGGVTEYGPDASGDAAPIARIGGIHTKLAHPKALTIAPDGSLYVASAHSRITVYAAGAHGNVTPTAILTGHVSSPEALVFDGANHLLVTDGAKNNVKVFAAKATGTDAPLWGLTGANPPLSAPAGLDVDDTDNLFVASSQTNTISEFAPGARGAANPLSVIFGSATGLSVPTFLAELPPAPFPKVTFHRLGHLTLKRIRHAGLTLGIRARGTLAFRSAPLTVSARLRAGRTTIATGRLTMTGPGRARVTLLPLLHIPHVRRHGLRHAVLRIALRHASQTQRRRLPTRLTR
jgi:hypothetical protein